MGKLRYCDKCDVFMNELNKICELVESYVMLSNICMGTDSLHICE